MDGKNELNRKNGLNRNEQEQIKRVISNIVSDIEKKETNKNSNRFVDHINEVSVNGEQENTEINEIPYDDYIYDSQDYEVLSDRQNSHEFIDGDSYGSESQSGYDNENDRVESSNNRGVSTESVRGYDQNSEYDSDTSSDEVEENNDDTEQSTDDTSQISQDDYENEKEALDSSDEVNDNEHSRGTNNHKNNQDSSDENNSQNDQDSDNENNQTLDNENNPQNNQALDNENDLQNNQTLGNGNNLQNNQALGNVNNPQNIQAPRNDNNQQSNIGNNLPIYPNERNNQTPADNDRHGNSNSPSHSMQPHKNNNLGVPRKENPNFSGNKKNDAAAEKLKKSNNNKLQKIWNMVRNRQKKKNSEENQANNNTTNTNDDNNEKKDLNLSDLLLSKIKIKIIIVAAIIVFFLLLILALLALLVGTNQVGSMPVTNPATYIDDEVNVYAPFYSEEDNKEEFKLEKEYYEKLKKINSENNKNLTRNINVNYIHTILIYYYYKTKNIDDPDELVDYKKMINSIDTIIDLMGQDDNIDYSIDGVFYNNLKNSDFIKSYYSDVLETTDIDTLLKEIFSVAEDLGDLNFTDKTVITSETTVTVTEKKTSETKTESKSTTLTINDYIADSIYATTNSIKNSESVKAYTIAYSTNLASQNNKLSIDSNNVSASNSLCSVKEGCSYDDNGNLVSGSGKQSSKNNTFYKGAYYYKKPLDDSEITALNKDINSVFGNVLVNSDGTYPSLDIDKMSGSGDGYKDILNNSYGDLSYKNIGEDSYILDGSYGTKKVQTKVIFYDQNDYGAYNFCGKKKETIQTSGCGTTSVAIIVSTYENNTKYDPVAMMNEAKKTGYCGGGITGTSPGFFKKEADTMKYKYYKASKYSKKDLNLVLQHLSQGHLVIVHMSPGHFTSGGHYMVLGGVDPETKKVYVYDPYNKVNSTYRKTGNGWYSFNDIIVKEAWNFYIIWKG